MTNRHRVSNATKALKPYEDGDDKQSPVVDLLTDLRHYCAKHGLSFDDAVRISADHLAAERIDRLV